MIVIKVIFIALITAIFSVYLKKYSPELAVFLSISAGVLIISLIFDYFSGFIDYIKAFFDNSGIDGNIFKTILKVLVVAYLVEFSIDLIRDLGENGLADKVLLVGKMVIMSLSLPIVFSLIEAITSVVNGGI